MTQQGEVDLYQTDDGGEITFTNGLITMGGGLNAAAYLSMFGGNFDDDGTTTDSLQWWGNLSETETAKQYRSETEYVLNSLSVTTSNLLLIEAAAERDLAWLVSEGVADSVEVTASMPGLNKVSLTVEITAQGEASEYTYIENWRARS